MTFESVKNKLYNFLREKFPSESIIELLYQDIDGNTLGKSFHNDFRDQSYRIDIFSLENEEGFNFIFRNGDTLYPATNIDHLIELINFYNPENDALKLY